MMKITKAEYDRILDIIIPYEELGYQREAKLQLTKNLERMIIEKFGPDFMFYNLKLDQINQFIRYHIVDWVICKTNQGFLGLKVEDFLYKFIFDGESETLKVEQMPYAYEQLENGVFPIKFFRPTKIVLEGLMKEYLEKEGK